MLSTNRAGSSVKSASSTCSIPRLAHPEADVLALVPRRADAEHCAAAGEDVERGDDLRQQARVAIADAGHEQAEPHLLRQRGEVAKHRVALEYRVLCAREGLQLEVVIHAGEHRAAGRFSRLRRIARMYAETLGAAGEREVDEVAVIDSAHAEGARGGALRFPRVGGVACRRLALPLLEHV